MCPQLPTSSLLHDGELTPAAQLEMRKHLAECGDCSAEWALLENEGQLFKYLHFDLELSMMERARLDRRLIETFSDRLDWIEVRRTAGLLSGLAASILVISSIWLMEFPSRHMVPFVSPANAPVSGPVLISSPSSNSSDSSSLARQDDIPAWERAALTLRVDPRPEDVPGNFDIGVASADGSMADWMVGGLGGGRGSHAIP